MNNCKNCKEQISNDWDYCPICGRPTKLRKIDKHYIIQEFVDFFSANKGLVYTIKNVLIRPGETVRQFITEDRYRLVKPVTFLFISSLIYAFVVQIFSITAIDYYQQPELLPIAERLINWTFEYPGYTNIIMGLLMAFWLKILFKKAGFNLFEIFILLCFVLGITNLFTSIVAIVEGVTNMKFLIFSLSFASIYTLWAIGQFFDRKKITSYLKAFLAYIFANIVLGIVVAIVVIIEIVINVI